MIKIRETGEPVKIKATNLYDEQKKKVLKVAFDKYNLEELQKMLNINNSDY